MLSTNLLDMMEDPYSEDSWMGLVGSFASSYMRTFFKVHHPNCFYINL